MKYTLPCVFLLCWLLSGCQVVKFFSSDENCQEKLKEAATCGALGEKYYEGCREDATAAALAATNAAGSVVLPDYSACENDRTIIQGFCWNTVRTRCL